MTVDRELPNGWTAATVGELATYQNGRAFKPSEWGTTGLPIIRIQNLNESTAAYNYSDDRHEERFRVKHSDLLFAWSASLGAHIWRGDDAWLNQHIFRVDHANQIDRRFLFYALTHITSTLYSKAHGSGMVHVTKGRFEETKLDLPPFNEQRRIAEKIDEIVSELEAAVNCLKKVNDQLGIYRTAVLKHAFEGKLTKHWREENKDILETPEQLLARIKIELETRYEQQFRDWRTDITAWDDCGRRGGKPRKPKRRPANTGLSRDVLSTLPNLPDLWAWGKLAWMTCSVEYGTAAKSAPTGEVPVLRMGNIRGGRFDWSDLVYTSDHDEVEKYLLHDGDVLFNRTNSPELVGKTAIYKGSGPAIFAGYLIRINHIESVVDGQYLNLFLNSRVARHYGNSVKTDGVNQSNINGAKLLNFPFPYCSIQEQRKIVSTLDRVLSVVDKIENEIATQLDSADALCQAILKRAFSGQLVPQDPSDEPASILLARIRAERERITKGTTRRKKAKVTA